MNLSNRGQLEALERWQFLNRQTVPDERERMPKRLTDDDDCMEAGREELARTGAGQKGKSGALFVLTGKFIIQGTINW